MSAISKLALIFAIAAALFAGFAVVCSLAGCTLRVDPQVDPPVIDIGCVVVNLGQSQVEYCPDAGGEVAMPSHNIPHPLDAGAQ